LVKIVVPPKKKFSLASTLNMPERQNKRDHLPISRCTESLFRYVAMSLRRPYVAASPFLTPSFHDLYGWAWRGYFARSMKLGAISLWILSLLALGGVVAHADAVIEGTVELPKSRRAPVMNQRYEIVSKGGILAPNPPVAVIYLEGNFPKATNAPVATLEQKDLLFVPALLPIQVGTRVEFPNLDSCYHNVFSYSPAKRFDLGRYRPDEKPVPSQVFETPGLVTVRCDIHEHMRGLILVLDTPHFTTSDTNGHFRLAGLPPGHFVLKAWLTSKTTLEKPVDIKDGGVLTVNFP
jgi:plastocyanin